MHTWQIVVLSIVGYKAFTITLRKVLWHYRFKLDPAGHFWL